MALDEPELLLACFQLEKTLCPSRPPSSTIAINRHAQFLPHRDSGAGSGQTTSLIVGLGDYVGGELLLETVAHDIRCVAVWLRRGRGSVCMCVHREGGFTVTALSGGESVCVIFYIA
jgi:hypothetical protein